MAEQASGDFLDVEALLERSVPRARQAWLWYGGGMLLLLVLLSTLVTTQVPEGAQIIDMLSSVAMLGIIAGLAIHFWLTARSVQREHRQVEAIEELMQLRRWGEAATMLQGLLSRPARTPQAWVQALIYLGSVLGRFHRFGDAVAVYDRLLEIEFADAQMAHGLRLARAMSLLRDDRLFDADRAINELRRSEGAERSAGLALVEIYRDVKTGHPREAIELFNQNGEELRRQLGHRIADAHALVARAHDLLDEEAAAAEAYERATLLAPEVELQRRYPEVAALAGRYRAAARPREAT